jgi:nitrite reductase (NO-forming)
MPAIASLSPARLAGLAGAAAALLALAACGSSATNGSGSSASPGGGSSTLNVSAKNFKFSSAQLSVPAGATVTVDFSNQDSTEHSFTLDNGGGEADADAGSSKSFSFTAPQSGSLSFHCKYHPTTMKGTISVGTGGAGGAATTSGSSSSNGYGY